MQTKTDSPDYTRTIMIDTNYLDSAIKQFTLYKTLGEKTIVQVPDDKLNWHYNAETNSIATLVKHISGNMLSRFTDLLESDGEKKWRNRDAEFEDEFLSREKILLTWNKGWNCLFEALHKLQPTDLSKIIFIRKEEHTVMEAINRQLTHYASHVGQIILIGKMVCGSQWTTLSIARNESNAFNREKGL